MERVALQGWLRARVGTHGCRKVRRERRVPGIVYGSGQAPINVELRRDDFVHLLHLGENVLIDLKIISDGEEETHTVIIRDAQHNSLTGDIIHVDFFQVSLTEKVTVRVPITVGGESKGVKEGGILDHHLWEVEVRCLPDQIPEGIKVDISNLDVGDSIRLRNLPPIEGVEILGKEDETILSVVPPTVAKEAVPLEEEIEEPEVISEKKVKEEEEEEEEKEKEKEKAEGK